MWCAWWDEWLLGSVVAQILGDACPFYSPSLLGTPEHSSVMEDVSVARDLPFKLSLGGEGEIWNWEKLSELLWQTSESLKNLKCVFAAQVFNACCCCAYKTDTLLTPSWAGFRDEGGVGFWGAPFFRVLGWGCVGTLLLL